MPQHQRVVIVLTTISLMILIFELVRKRRLREEYSWLWLLTACAVFVLAWMPHEALLVVARFMGSENPPAAIFFMGFCLVALLCLQFSVRLSRMTEQVKTLAQKIALLEQDIERERALQRERENVGQP
jgi:hypothetical protein